MIEQQNNSQIIELLKNEIKSLSDLLRINFRVDNISNKTTLKINNLLRKIETANDQIISLISDTQKENSDLHFKLKNTEEIIKNANIQKEQLIILSDDYKKQVENSLNALNQEKIKGSNFEKEISNLKLKLEDEESTRKKLEIDNKLYKDKQEKLVELLQQMEKNRDKKSGSSKKDSTLAHQCSQMKENIEMLTQKLENMKENYDEQIVFFIPINCF